MTERIARGPGEIIMSVWGPVVESLEGKRPATVNNPSGSNDSSTSDKLSERPAEEKQGDVTS